MTVPVNDRRISYTATASQTVFPYDFEIESDSEIIVNQNGIDLTITTHYTVSGVGTLTGGNITLVTGATAGDIITIIGNTALSRNTDFTQAGDFFASEVNEQLDKIIRILQENKTNVSRSILLDSADTKTSVTLPLSTNLANKFLAFDSNGDPVAASSVTGAPVTAFMETLLDDTDADTARTTLDAQEDVITTRGDIIRGSSSNKAERLALGSAEKILKSNGNDVVWGDYQSSSNLIKGINYINKQIIIANGTDAEHDIDSTAGNFEFDDGSGSAKVSALTKQMDATFALGTNAGGMAEGVTLGNATWYYIFAVSNADGSITDLIADSSATGVNVAADSVVVANSLTKKKKVQSFVTDGSANIVSFITTHGEFQPDQLIERYVNGSTWYEKYKSGRLRQGGVASGSSPIALTYPIAFSNTQYSLAVTANANNSTTTCAWNTKQTTGVTLYSASGVLDWIAEGMYQ